MARGSAESTLSKVRSSAEDLLGLLDKFSEVSALVIGDIILDRYIWGNVERISPEAPVPVVDVRKVEDRLGGAGNAVRNLCAIGAKVSLCGMIGDDEEGQRVLQLLDQSGVNKEGVMIDRGRPTSLKTRVIAHSQQVVRIDREDTRVQGVALSEGLAAMADAHLENSGVVIVSDYGKGAIAAPLFKRLSAARQEGRLGSRVRPLVVDPHPHNYDLYDGITIAKPNRKEAEVAVGFSIDSPEAATKAAQLLCKRWNSEMMMITLGEGGLMILPAIDQQAIFLETVAREVFDVSGAGDTVTALFSAALALGASPSLAGDLANIAAGIVVSEVGTVPINVTRLRSDIEKINKNG